MNSKEKKQLIEDCMNNPMTRKLIRVILNDIKPSFVATEKDIILSTYYQSMIIERIKDIFRTNSPENYIKLIIEEANEDYERRRTSRNQSTSRNR